MLRSAQNVSPAFYRRVIFQPLCGKAELHFELISTWRDKHAHKLKNIKTEISNRVSISVLNYLIQPITLLMSS